MSDVLYEKSPSFPRTRPFFFLLSIILVAAVIGIFMLIWGYFTHKTTSLRLEPGLITYEEGFLNKEEIELDMSTVRTTRVSQTVMNRIMGVGKLEIFTAGDKPEITINGIPDPDSVQDIIRAHNKTA